MAPLRFISLSLRWPSFLQSAHHSSNRKLVRRHSILWLRNGGTQSGNRTEGHWKPFSATPFPLRLQPLPEPFPDGKSTPAVGRQRPLWACSPGECSSGTFQICVDLGGSFYVRNCDFRHRQPCCHSVGRSQNQSFIPYPWTCHGLTVGMDQSRWKQ